MKTFLKVVTILAAAAGVVLLVMRILEADKRKTEDKKRIAMFKGKFSVPTRKSGDLKAMADEIADFRGGDDEDAYLFEDISTDTELSDDDKYADIFGVDDEVIEDIAEAVEEVVEEAAAEEDGDISEDSLAQLLDS